MREKKIKEKRALFGRRLGNGLQLVLFGALTGAFAGVIVTCYTLLAAMSEEFSRGYYGFFRDNPAFIPLLFLALALGSVVVGGIVRFFPYIRGSGIPQTEGSMRGLMRFSWYRSLTGMFVSSLLCIFLGMSAGSEGPSILIGGSAGAGVSETLRTSAFIRRYQVTGGACAGLAVAFNAPLTGIVFAFEEGQKRFTPEVFVCSFTSVTVAVLIRNLLLAALGRPVGAYFSTFSFSQADMLAPVFYAYILFAALIVSLVGIGFFFALFALKKLFSKIKFWKGIGKFLIPFLLAGAVGLIAAEDMGGGHAFIASLGSGSEGVGSVFSAPLWVSLIIIVLLKLLVTAFNMGAGVPCGAFIPMLAIGAGLGALMGLLLQKMGMPAGYADALIVICMAVFFTTVVRAPLTGVIMTVELTWNFAFLLPAVLGVAVGYLIGDVFRVKPVYERLLDEMLFEDGNEHVERFAARFCVEETSPVIGRKLSDILFPSDVRITRIERGEERFIPDGNSRLQAGDILTAEGELFAGSDAPDQLTEMLGEPLKE